MDFAINFILVPVIKIALIMAIVPGYVAVITLAERKVIAWMQVRLGPMRVGPWGILQMVADPIKLLLKEDIVPSGADKWIFMLAPVVCLIPAFIVLAVIPLGPTINIAPIHAFGRTLTIPPINPYVTDINIGVLYVLSISSVGVLGIILGGWASNSKYPLMGALRSAAQMVSYEVALGFSIIGVLMLSGTLSLVSIVEAQKNSGIWYVFYQPIGFLLFFVCGVAETNRAPFDMPEAESELVAGFHTEYSGFRFSLFFLAEYANMLTVAAMAVTLFWGGWLRPFPNVAALAFLDWIPPVLWFAAKVIVFLYFYLWFRASWPRYRYDQLMKLGWQFLLPISMANVIVTALLVVFMGGQMKVKRPDLSFLKKLFLVDLIKGMMLTFSHQRPSKNYTEQYPKARPKIAERFRGAPRLNNDPDTGETLCIACNLCALACPEHCIEVGWERTEAGKKALTTYTFDLSRCMFCGLCEDACPTPCLELTQDFELSLYDRRNMKWDRQKLEEGNQPVVYTK